MADERTFKSNFESLNRFGALHSLDSENNVTAQINGFSFSKKINQPKRPTAYNELNQMHIDADTDHLLLGDSMMAHAVIVPILEYEGGKVANLAVSGLNMCQQMKWLTEQPQIDSIKKVTGHIGITSCYYGPVSAQVWEKLIATLTHKFPSASVQNDVLIYTSHQ